MPRPVKYSVGSSKREVYKPSQQACPPQEALPRYYFVQPLQNTPNAWQGSSVYADFEVPAQTGVMTEATLRFRLQNLEAGTQLPSTPFWVDHIEVYIGSDLVETIWKHDIWNEEIGFRSFQELGVVATATSDTSSSNPSAPTWSLYNSDLDGTFPDQVVSNYSGNQFWFLNIPSCMRSAKPYVRGFASRIRFRVYFPTNLEITSPLVSPQLSLGEVLLIVEEAQTDAGTIAELERAHRQSVVDYTILVRSRVQQSFGGQQISASGQQTPMYLRGFKNKSAGVVVYSTQASAFDQGSSVDMNTRLQASTYQLLDAQNNKITEVLPVEWLETYVFHDSVSSFSTTQFDPSVATMVIFPFSSDFNTTINKGCSYGGFRFTTLEQLVLTYSGTNGGAGDAQPRGVGGWSSSNSIVVTATSYDYAHLTISGGRHSVRFE